MAFVDELKIHARAGRGGDGVVRWLHMKGKEYGGPSGGNGGNGGDVYVQAVRDISLLASYRGDKEFKAQDGAPGENENRHGKSGDDFVIKLPVGSLVRNGTTGEVFELLKEDDRRLLLKGGRGGAGNSVFKSSVNQRPEESTPGTPGEEADVVVELRLIADGGLVGLPNAGKTSLLNALTGASAKVGAYAFTTLDPNLGALYGYILADIPGLIEGASQGKGLGSKFLRHIARTRLLIHCISLESDDPKRDYETVRGELKSFEGADLEKKTEIIALTKSDTRDISEIGSIQKIFEDMGKKVLTVSVLDDAEVKAFGEELVRIFRAQ
jgi:GTP-binding protein